jgi:hypothetical protein
MAAISIYWGDGTGDLLTATYTGTPGASSLTLSSPPNGAPVSRSATLTLANTVGSNSATLTVTQEAMSDALLLATYAGEYVLDGADSYVQVDN